MPFPESEGFFIEPGTVTSIALRKRIMERLGEVDHTIYKAKYSDCIDVLDWNVNEFAKIDAYTSTRLAVAYSRIGCINTCIQKAVMEECEVNTFCMTKLLLRIFCQFFHQQCYDYNYPSEGDLFPENVDTLCSYFDVKECKFGTSFSCL